jgi:hypothetical protein
VDLIVADTAHNPRPTLTSSNTYFLFVLVYKKLLNSVIWIGFFLRSLLRREGHSASASAVPHRVEYSMGWDRKLTALSTRKPDARRSPVPRK